MNFIKQTIKFLYFSLLRKNVKAAFSASLDMHSSYGEQVRIGPHSLIGDCQIGSNVIIKEKCEIKRSKLHDNTCIHESCKIAESVIGSYTYIARSSEIVGTHIGNFCSIGPEVRIRLGKHPVNFISTSPVFYAASGYQLGFSFATKQLFDEYQNCKIGNDVWIGARVIILDGITIGDGAIVAANSVVSKDVEPYAIVGGIPARFIKYRFDEAIINKLKSSTWWNWDKAHISRKINSFQKIIQTDSDIDLS